MGRLVDLIDKIRRYYKFTPSELKGFVITILVLSFIISFREWGKGRTFDPAVGLFNWFNSILVVALVLIVFTSAQRIVGLSVGYRVEYKMWTFGLLIGLLFAFVSRGVIWVLLPGGIMLHHLAGHRLGFFRYGLSYYVHGLIASAGPISLICLGAIFKIINNYISNPLISKLILFSIILAIYDILPIPPMTGSRLFFGSRMVYSFVFCTIIPAGILLILDINVLFAIVLAIIIGIICWLLYYIFFEHKYWRGPFPKGWGPKK